MILIIQQAKAANDVYMKDKPECFQQTHTS